MQFDISDDESEDEDDIENTLPLVSDMLMRPYMINQTMTKSTSDSLGISDLMETSTTNLSMFDKRRRYLVRDSMDFRDKNGKVRATGSKISHQAGPSKKHSSPLLAQPIPRPAWLVAESNLCPGQ